MKKKLFSLLVAMAFCLTMLPASPIVSAADDETVTLYLEDGSITVGELVAVQGGSPYQSYDSLVITNRDPDTATSNTIKVTNGGVFTIQNVNISASGAAAIDTTGSGATINFSGTNTLYSSDDPAIYVTEQILTLTGEDDAVLTALTGSTGAAIGSGSGEEFSGSIIIESGTVNATNEQSNSGAAIGSGASGLCSGSIAITGGTVNAAARSGAAIGSGAASSMNTTVFSGTITISGGTVNATITSGSAAAIGSGNMNENSGTINITGGTVNATSVGGAGIGSGRQGDMTGKINITGGTVTASGSSGAGIGSGDQSDMTGEINITGGTVTASSTSTIGFSGAGIGTGNKGTLSGTINITVDTVEASAVDNAAIGVGVNGTVTETAVYNLSDGIVVNGETLGSLTEEELAKSVSGATTAGITVSHSYTVVVTEPTCTEAGYTTYTCTGCGDSYTADEVPATGHTEAEAVTENEVAATCTENGSYDSVVYCSVCGEELSREIITVPAIGHTWGNPAFAWAADYSTATATFTCENCGETTTAEAEITSVTDGDTTTYTATVTLDGVEYTQSVSVVDTGDTGDTGSDDTTSDDTSSGDTGDTGDTVLMGDTNGDGTITAADALLALRHAVGLTTLTGDAFTAGEMNSDGTITAADALLILRIAVGLA